MLDVKTYKLVTTVDGPTQGTWLRMLPDDSTLMSVTWESVCPDSNWVEATGDWMSLIMWLVLDQGAGLETIREMMKPASQDGFIVAATEVCGDDGS